MKILFLLFLLSKFSISISAQISYFDLDDLNTICKKEDFESVNTFLKNKGFKIDVFKTNYDHGSYFVIAQIEASNSQNGNMIDEIRINFEENNFDKELSITQRIVTNNAYNVLPNRTLPLEFWRNENWTSAVYSKNGTNTIYLGQRNYSFGFEDTLLAQIPKSKIAESISLLKSVKSEDYFYSFFINSNTSLGELKYYILNYHSIPENFDYSITMKTKFLKGKNIIGNTNKILEFPIIRNGKIYLINLKFGNLIKKYVLDSGASDMSIDQESYQYLKNSNQIKIENRLSAASYQLADGSIVKFQRINIPKFNINNIEVKNIDATIIENGKPLLLGKSFLDSFKSWKIDNERNILIVELF